MPEKSRVSLPSCDCLPISNQKSEQQRRTSCVRSHQYIEKILSGTSSYKNYIMDSITIRGLWDRVFSCNNKELQLFSLLVQESRLESF
jgi:hypothetical protein